VNQTFGDRIAIGSGITLVLAWSIAEFLRASNAAAGPTYAWAVLALSLPVLMLIAVGCGNAFAIARAVLLSHDKVSVISPWIWRRIVLGNAARYITRESPAARSDEVRTPSDLLTVSTSVAATAAALIAVLNSGIEIVTGKIIVAPILITQVSTFFAAWMSLAIVTVAIETIIATALFHMLAAATRSRPASVLISSLLWGVLHGINGHLLQVPSATLLFALLLGVYSTLSSSWKFSRAVTFLFFAHSLNNTIALFLILLRQMAQ
jgi:hypothetical protein